MVDTKDRLSLVGVIPSHSIFGCGRCTLVDHCLPTTLDEIEIGDFNEIVSRGRPLRKGDHIFLQGDKFKSVYSILSGSFKTVHTALDGVEQVTGFYFPGEIVGLSYSSVNQHFNSAIALETSSVCTIPFERFKSLSREIPVLQDRFLHLIGNQISESQSMLAMNHSSADERIALFILNLSARKVRQKLSATQFRLVIKRSDIGNYLGLTIETVSRTFSRFQKLGTLAINNNEIQILDIAGLEKLANIRHCPSAEHFGH
jgi:CRP/FNR family transcriptional regulator